MFGRKRKLDDFSAEIQAHLQLEVERLQEQGLSEEEARAAACRAFGNVTQARERFYESGRWLWWDHFSQDVRYGLRMLRKSPGFTTVAVLTLALGIGANTAIFSVIDAVFLSSLPYPNSEQVAMVWEDVHLPHYQNSQDTPAPGNFADWNKRNTVFSGMVAIGYRSWNVTGSGEPVRIEGEAFSGDIFSVLQTYPFLGRAFTAEEDRPGAASHVALLGYGLWASRFGADRKVIGQRVLLDGEDYEVIGVMPPDFRFPDPDDQLYVPIALSDEDLANHSSHYRQSPGA
jgi:hypothetical protein